MVTTLQQVQPYLITAVLSCSLGIVFCLAVVLWYTQPSKVQTAREQVRQLFAAAKERMEHESGRDPFRFGKRGNW
jgi:ABC-type transporter Mla subunit MlaD